MLTTYDYCYLAGVAEALELFYRRDIYLVHVNAHERSLTFRLGMYLQQIFPDWHIDCEYNRNRGDVKRIPGRRVVYPDIIIHKRGTTCNLLAVEAKPPCSSPDEIEKDRKKIEKYVKSPTLKYRYGLFIEFKMDFESTCANLQWCRFADGTPQWFRNDAEPQKNLSAIGFEVK